VGALDVGYTALSRKSSPVPLLYLLNADESAATRDLVASDGCVIYQGHHGDRGASIADIVLPGAAYTEKRATYVNTEGRPLQTARAVTPPGLAREDWKIVRALSENAGQTLPYESLDGLRDHIAKTWPHLVQYGVVQAVPSQPTRPATKAKTKATEAISPWLSSLEEFYMTDAISRASPTMAKCVQSVRSMP
jgi:NADH dehydrogenase (ubiquinone) Fe-S protein 1